MTEPKTYNTAENYDWMVSHHACDRWIERIGKTSDTWAARTLIQLALSSAITIPNRYAATRWVERNVNHAFSRRSGIRFHLAGAAVVITGGSRVLTVLKATEEDYATSFVWILFGIWLED